MGDRPRLLYFRVKEDNAMPRYLAKFIGTFILILRSG
jgi:hypothetical protein